MRNVAFMAFGIAIAFAMIVGCGGEEDLYNEGGSDSDSDGDGDNDDENNDDDDDDGDDGPEGDPPLLDIDHMGWDRPVCADCHGSGNPDHYEDYENWECAQCHGDNGAAHPPRKDHGFESCTFTCHNETAHPDETSHHGYKAHEECNWCHWGTKTLE